MTLYPLSPPKSSTQPLGISLGIKPGPTISCFKPPRGPAAAAAPHPQKVPVPIPRSLSDAGPREAFHPPDLDVPVAAVPQQRVGQAGAVPPPAVVDAEHNLRQAWWPLQQELMAHGLQVAHHQLQDASIGQVLQQERMHILLLCPGREKEPDLNEGPSVPGSPIFFGRGERRATAGAG